MTDVGWAPVALPERNRSTIVSVPLAGRDPAGVLAALRAASVVAATRDGHLRLSVHLYNDEDDVAHLARVLPTL